MKELEITNIIDPGAVGKEFVWLKANANLDIGNYTITDNTYASGSVSNKWRHTYSFPDKQIKKGDWVRLWTKSGINKESEGTFGDNKVKIHEFFMNMGSSVWNKDGDVARLFYQIHAFTKKKV
jgi:hypothetical protein